MPMTARRPDGSDLQRGFSRIWQRAGAALEQLVESHQFARELDRSVWDFAVEIDDLHRAGLNNSDLRWLICKGYLLHAREVPPAGDQVRTFRPAASLVFGKTSCFVLTEAGVTLLGDLMALAGRAGPTIGGPDTNGDGVAPLPCWDRARQELRVGSVVVKQYKVRAVNQGRVLAAFEEEGWPVRLDDPLPPLPEQDPKRRLHDTINALNRNQKQRLIGFMGVGSGQGIRWALVRPPAEENGDGQRSRGHGTVPHG